MESLEKTGKTVDDAINSALKELNLPLSAVEVTILEQGSRGIFGIGSKAAKVLVTKKFDPESIVKTFLRELSTSMNLVVEVETKLADRQMYVNMKGDDMGVFIGKRGQTLDSLQYLLNLIVNKGSAPFISITLDTENYRQRRKETLEALAYNLAKKAKITKKDVVLEPMNPYERRIIHSVLQSDRFITTHSEGSEPFRNVVISPKK